MKFQYGLYKRQKSRRISSFVPYILADVTGNCLEFNLRRVGLSFLKGRNKPPCNNLQHILLVTYHKIQQQCRYTNTSHNYFYVIYLTPCIFKYRESTQLAASNFSCYNTCSYCNIIPCLKNYPFIKHSFQLFRPFLSPSPSVFVP